MRRQTTDNNSFDLFLDTICNTFGGIIFLAILLAILIQTRAIVKTPEQRDESPPSVQEVHDAISRLDEVKSAYAAIAAALENLPPVELSEDDSKFKVLLQQRESVQKRLTESINEQATHTELLATQIAENSKLMQEIAEVPRRIQEAESKLDEKNEEFQTLVSKRQTTVRLPRVRDSAAASALLLLKDSQFHLATSSPRSRQFEDQYVTTQTKLGGGTTIKPRVGKGWDPNDPRLAQMIEDVRSRGHVVTIAVWPESFGDFKVIKGMLIQNQVPYQLWPQQTGEDLTVYFGSGQSSVQ